VFAQLDEAELQSADLNECVEDTLAMFQYHLKRDVTVRKELAHLPAINCYPAKINQLCFQLLSNANRAIDGSGEIVLRTEASADEIRFSVSDNGRGISAEDIERIFDPGYTGWDVNVGTGLGLAICYQVAREHNGRITVESEPGKGSTFVLSLPVVLVQPEL
jgi:signal transduction histidine kinase